MKIPLLSMAAFLLSLAAGRFLAASWSMPKAVSPAAGGITGLDGNHPKLPARHSAIPAPPTPAKSGLPEQIAWERRIWRMETDGLAEEFTSLLNTAASTEQVFRFLAIWQERDPDGFIAWAGQQPNIDMISLGETDTKIGLSSMVMEAAARKDPEYAWRLAVELAGNSHSSEVNRGYVIGSLLEQDVEAARAFVIKHRDKIASFGQGNIGWYNRDPQKVLPVALELPPGQVRTSIIAELARYYGERPDTIAAAREWFLSLPAEHRKELSLLPQGDRFYRISETHRKNLQEVWPVAE